MSFAVQENLLHLVRTEGVVHVIERVHRLGDEEVGDFAFRDGAQLAPDIHSVGRVDGGGVDRLLGQHLVHHGTHGEDELHVAGRAGAGVEVGGKRDGQTALDHLADGGALHPEEERRAGQHRGHRLALVECRNLLIARVFQVVNRQCIVFYADLDAAGAGHLVGVDFRPQTVLDALHQDALGLLGGEEALVAEDVHEVGELLGRHHRNHLVDDEIHVAVGIVLVEQRYRMGSEEVGLDGERGVLFQLADDAQHLELVLGGEAVAALDLARARAEGGHLLQPLPCLVVELFFGCLVQPFRGVEDAAAALEDFLVAQTLDLVDVLDLAAARIDDVRVGIAEGGEHELARGVNFLDGLFDFLQDVGVEVLHLAELLDFVALGEEVGVVDDGEVLHLLAGAELDGFGFRLH